MRNPRPNDKTNSAAGTVYDPAGKRRFALQRAGAKLLSRFKVTKLDRHGDERQHYEHRLCMCQRGTDGGAPVIMRSPDKLRARFAGLQTCGSTWVCALCAPKVTATRRDEMNLALAAHVNGGGAVYLATYTMQHTKEAFGQGKLADALAALKVALKSLKGHRDYKALRKLCIGVVRALEVTYGELNGWHCHTHELIFAEPGMLPALSRFRKLWARILIKHGISGLQPGDIGVEKFRKMRALLTRCFTVQPGEYAAEYVAKFGREPERHGRGRWGLGSEMTRGHMKHGRADDGESWKREGHASPWDLLNDALDGDARSGVLWTEYALAFKGSRQLYWSTGLRAHFFGIVERSDEEIAAEPDQRRTEHVIEIGPVSWQRVLEHDARFDLLRIAAERGADGVRAFLSELEHAPPTHSGHYEEGRAVFLRRAA